MFLSLIRLRTIGFCMQHLCSATDLLGSDTFSLKKIDLLLSSSPFILLWATSWCGKRINCANRWFFCPLSTILSNQLANSFSLCQGLKWSLCNETWNLALCNKISWCGKSFYCAKRRFPALSWILSYQLARWHLFPGVKLSLWERFEILYCLIRWRRISNVFTPVFFANYIELQTDLQPWIKVFTLQYPKVNSHLTVQVETTAELDFAKYSDVRNTMLRILCIIENAYK